MKKELKLLILSEILVLSSFGLIAPIFAIFIIGLEGGSIISAGLATTIFFVVRSVVQLPLSRYYIDKTKHKARLLLLGTTLILIVPFIYLFAKKISHVFFAQFVYGLGAAFAYPSFFSLFTKHMNKRRRGFEYSLLTTGTSLGIAFAAIIGANIADLFDFRVLFFFVGGMAFLGFLLLIFLEKAETVEIRKRMKIEKRKERERKRILKNIERLKRKKYLEQLKKKKNRERLKRKRYREELKKRQKKKSFKKKILIKKPLNKKLKTIKK